MIVGIRHEDKNRWERRAPLTPTDVETLIRDHGLRFRVQPSLDSPARVVPDSTYEAAGAEIADDLTQCDLVMGVKEMPESLLHPDGAYLFFSHTIKGQPYNMPMLETLLEHGSTLFDYELITDDEGRRLVSFSRYAGLAGMIDTLVALGKRLGVEGIDTPFASIKMAHEYADLETAKVHLREVGKRIESQDLDDRVAPVVIGVAGYGKVSQGASEILACLPVTVVEPADLPALRRRSDLSARTIYTVVFKESDMVRPRDEDATFDLADYYAHPEGYVSVFNRYTPHLTVLVNAILWDERYPRLVTKGFARGLYEKEGQPHLRVIGDISCDIEGSIEFTVKATEPDAPCYVYDPATDRVRDGVEGQGPVVMAIDNLPCELPLESSEHFSAALVEQVAGFAHADLRADFDTAGLSPIMKRAAIAYRGRLRPEFEHLASLLPDHE